MMLARAALRPLRSAAKRSLAVDAAQLEDTAAQLLKRHGVAGVQAALIDGGQVKPVNAGLADVASGTPVASSTLFQLASLSKPVAARRALTRFDADAPVNDLLKAHGSPWRVEGQDGWGDAVTVSHLIDHSALGLHYVPGVPESEPKPSSLELVSGQAEKWGYAAVECVKKPGSAFAYSGGGFLVLQHLLECAPVWKSKFYGAFVLNHRFVLHAIDATPARWRGGAGSSPLDRARTAASSPRNDLVKNCTRLTG
jgi:CubicO group peptidase (beta-lactamase class C family)